MLRKWQGLEHNKTVVFHWESKLFSEFSLDTTKNKKYIYILSRKSIRNLT